MLVDDEILALRALEKRVNWEAYGFTDVLTARSAAEARQQLSQTAVDLVLSDVEMPEEDGLSLVSYIRSAYPRTDCIMVTCHADFNYLKEAMHSGVIDYILKPVDYDELGRQLTRFKKDREKHAETAPAPRSASTESGEDDGTVEKRLALVRDYIEEHLTEKIYVADLAKLVHLNEQYFMRVFKRVNGKSVTEYITDRRIYRARELLMNSGYSIQYIADRTGFDNVSYFTKLFKSATDMTPREYRIKFGKQK